MKFQFRTIIEGVIESNDIHEAQSLSAYIFKSYYDDIAIGAVESSFVKIPEPRLTVDRSPIKDHDHAQDEPEAS